VAELLETVEIETAPRPRAAVIWMHGLGADGHDFEPIVPELGLGDSPPVRFIFPHAPMRPVTVNAGMVMRAWYDVASEGGMRREDEQGVRASQQAIEALIEREQRRGLPAGRIVHTSRASWARSTADTPTLAGKGRVALTADARHRRPWMVGHARLAAAL
jgi:predicted esterase